MFFKIAFRNVRRQIGSYLIYFVTVVLVVALLFSVDNVVFSEPMAEVEEQLGSMIRLALFAVIFSLAVVVAAVLSYVTSFLLGRRKREFGLYLTLGMTRLQVLGLFLFETLFLFLFALGLGIVFGMGLYQVMMTVFTNFMEMDSAPFGYSAEGLLLTIAIVCVIFLLSSLFCLFYLRYAKIVRLLHGETGSKRAARLPVLWLGVGLLCVGGIVFAAVLFEEWRRIGDYFRLFSQFLAAAAIFSVSVALLHVGIAKSVMPLLLRRKKLAVRGTRAFTLRQLAQRQNRNAVLSGALAFLFAVAVVCTNCFLTETSILVENVEQRYPFDFNGEYYDWGQQQGDLFDEMLSIMDEYAGVEDAVAYTLYQTGDEDTENTIGEEEERLVGLLGYENRCTFLEESVYRKLCAMSGEPAAALDDGYVICAGSLYFDELFLSDFKDLKLSIGAETYFCTGISYHTFLSESSAYFQVVVPDEAVKSLTPYYENLSVLFRSSRYDAEGLLAALGFKQVADERGNHIVVLPEPLNHFALKERERLIALKAPAVELLAALFVMVVFVLLAVALLSVRILAMLAEDREKYVLLSRLGADEGMICRSLFSQIFFHFFLPTVIPLLLGFLVAWIYRPMLIQWKMPAVFFVSLSQAAIVFAVLLVLHFLYLLLTYLVARRDVKRALRSVG